MIFAWFFGIYRVWRGKFSFREGFGPWRPWWPLLAAILFLTLWALSPRVHLVGVRILIVPGVEEAFGNFLSVFRSSGRFIWPLYYAVMIGILAGWLRRDERWVTPMLLALLLVQAFELWPFYHQFPGNLPNPAPAEFGALEPRLGPIRRMQLVPAAKMARARRAAGRSLGARNSFAWPCVPREAGGI
jgi:hypothetical protein